MAEAAAAKRIDPWIVWFGGGAFFICYLGQTVLGVVQPTIDTELHLSASEAQWVVNSFFLGLALFAALGGRLGDYYGHKRVLIIFLGIFGLGSVSAAVSQGFVWLVVSNFVAGVGASTLYPSSAALVANSVPLRIRGKAIGQYSAIGVSVFIFAPLAAGLLTEAIGWRAVFGMQMLLAAGLAYVGWYFVNEIRTPEPEPLDGRGLGYLLVGLTAVLVALMQALAWGVGSPSTILLFAGGMAILLGFVLFESRREDPLLDVNLLRRRVIAGIVIAMFCAQFLLNGFFIYIATYFQHILGFGPLKTAAAILPAALIAPYAALVIGRITDRLGARRPAIFGYGIAAAALLWLALFVGEDEYWVLVPGLFMLSLATAPMFTALLTALSNAVGADERGDANALVLTIRWIGAAAGTMVLGVVIHSTETGAGIPTDSGYSTAFLVAAGAALVGVVACAILLPDPPPDKQRKQHHFRPHF